LSAAIKRALVGPVDLEQAYLISREAQALRARRDDLELLTEYGVHVGRPRVRWPLD